MFDGVIHRTINTEVDVSMKVNSLKVNYSLLLGVALIVAVPVVLGVLFSILR
jgi:hypothetical protein